MFDCPVPWGSRPRLYICRAYGAHHSVTRDELPNRGTKHIKGDPLLPPMVFCRASGATKVHRPPVHRRDPERAKDVAPTLSSRRSEQRERAEGSIRLGLRPRSGQAYGLGVGLLNFPEIPRLASLPRYDNEKGPSIARRKAAERRHVHSLGREPQVER